MKLTTCLAAGVLLAVGVAKGSPIYPYLVPFGSLTFSGVNGSASATFTFSVQSTADIVLQPHFGALGQELPDVPLCPRGQTCHGGVDAAYSITGTGTRISDDSSLDAIQNAVNGFCCEYFKPFYFSRTTFLPGIYTVALSIFSLGDSVPATNQLQLFGDVLSGDVTAGTPALDTSAASPAPEPGTLALSIALLLGLATVKKIRAFRTR
jgi:hypothetical protein